MGEKEAACVDTSRVDEFFRVNLEGIRAHEKSLDDYARGMHHLVNEQDGKEGFRLWEHLQWERLFRAWHGMEDGMRGEVSDPDV